MASHSTTEHGEHEDAGHGVHLPDPSVWPLFVGLACFIAGAALIWWSRDRDSSLAGPLLGVGIAMLLISAGGWAYEDGRMRRKAESGETVEPRAPRYNQVVTFAIPEGQASIARTTEGVIGALNSTELRDLEGFEDLRITVSPATEGPSQVLVETTWRGREGLDTYEATRQTLLDIVNRFPGQVMPGTVQVFDMEVVRDTKHTAFRFSLGAAATLLVGLAIGGALLGVTLSAFQNEATATEGGGNGTPAPADNVVVATDNRFNKTTLVAPPNTQVTYHFENKGQSKHNLQFLDREGGQPLAQGATGAIIDGGNAEDITFTTPGPGTYYFHCEVHPTEMKGTFTVQEGAPIPGATPGGGGGGGGGPTLTATDNKYDKSELDATAGQTFTLTFRNNGKILHNVHFLTQQGGTTLAQGAEGKIINGGQSETITFTAPAAGTYFYQCDVHPTEMTGKFVVR
jgi:plastocyanin